MSRPGLLRPRRRLAVLGAAVAIVALATGAQTASAADAKLPACTRTVSGDAGPQSVASGEVLCLKGAAIEGTVTVNPGGQLSVQTSRINGALTLSGAARLTFCGSTIIGAISATGGTGEVSIGDNHSCIGSYIDGAVTVSGNTSLVRLAGATVTGAVTVNGNATGVSTGPRIADNHIGGDLGCASNTPKPTNTGRPNTVDGARSGQCIAARF